MSTPYLPQLPNEGELNWYLKRKKWDEAIQNLLVGDSRLITAYPEGYDTRDIPVGEIFGIYKTIDPSPPSGTMPTYVGHTSVNSGGSVESFSLDINPSSPNNGTAVQPNDWMIAIVSAGPLTSGNFWDVPDGWTQIFTNLTGIGTMRSAVFVRKRMASDLNRPITFTHQAASHLSGVVLWVRNAANEDLWTQGPIKYRYNPPTETVTCTALGIPIPNPPMLVLSISLERTSTSESGVTWDGATPLLYVPQVGNVNTTIAIGYQSVADAAITEDVIIHYENSQTNNAAAFTLGIRGV